MKIKRNADLKAIMRKKSITQYDLGLILGVSETTVCRMLNHKLDEKTRAKILKALGSVE